jgi:hypothetical protein
LSDAQLVEEIPLRQVGARGSAGGWGGREGEDAVGATLGSREPLGGGGSGEEETLNAEAALSFEMLGAFARRRTFFPRRSLGKKKKKKNIGRTGLARVFSYVPPKLRVLFVILVVNRWDILAVYFAHNPNILQDCQNTLIGKIAELWPI